MAAKKGESSFVLTHVQIISVSSAYSCKSGSDAKNTLRSHWVSFQRCQVKVRAVGEARNACFFFVTTVDAKDEAPLSSLVSGENKLNIQHIYELTGT